MSSSKPKNVAHPHDALIKRCFGEAEHAAGELKAVLPDALATKIDWTSLKVETQPAVDQRLQTRQMDMLYSVRIQNHPAYLYLVFEAQRSVDRSMALRLFVYMARIWDDWMRTRSGDWPPPVILPIVLYHGEGHWKRSTRFESLFELSPEVAQAIERNIPNFSFLLDDLSRSSDKELQARHMSLRTMLALAALKHGTSEAMRQSFWQRWSMQIHELLEQKEGHDELETVLWYVLLVNRDIDERQLGEIMLKHFGPQAQEAVQTAGQRLVQQGRIAGHRAGRVEGRRAGRVEGRQEERARMLIELLTLRFGELSSEEKRRIQSSGLQKLEVLSRRVFDADSVDEMFDS